MPLLPIVAGGPGGQFNQDSNQQGHPLGSLMMFADGRRFRYGQATGTAIATASLCQQTLNNANRDELAVAAAVAAGARVITVTNGSAAIAVDDLVDGWVNIEDDAGEGYLYAIKSNDAAAGGATVTLDLYEDVQVALTTATTVLLFINPYGLVIIHPSPATAMLVGVTLVAVTASNFAWFQDYGPASVVTQGTVVINEKVIDSASADGAVAPTASTAAGEENYVGVVMEAAATTEHSLINLRM